MTLEYCTPDQVTENVVTEEQRLGDVQTERAGRMRHAWGHQLFVGGRGHAGVTVRHHAELFQGRPDRLEVLVVERTLPRRRAAPLP